MVSWLARRVARHPFVVLAAVAAIAACLGAFLPRISFQTDYSEMLPADDPVVEQFRHTQELFGGQSVFMLAMVAEKGGTLFDLPSLQKLYALTDELRQLVDRGWVEEITSPATVEVVEGSAAAVSVGPILSGPPQSAQDVAAFRERALAERTVRDSLILADGSAAVVVLHLHHRVRANEVVLGGVLDALQQAARRHGGPERFHIGGDGALMAYMSRYMRGDLRSLLPAVVVAVSAVLLVSFRTLRGVVLPLATVLIATLWTMGLAAACGVQLTIITTFLPVLLVAVGSAYGIHMVNDYLQRVGTGGDRRAVVEGAVREMFAPVLGAALTTAAGFLTLLSSFLGPTKEFGLFAAFGVVAAFLLTVTFIPAVLVLLPSPRRGVRRAGGRFDRAVGRIAGGFARRPGWAVAAAVAAVGVLLAGVPMLQVEADFTRYFRAGSPVMQSVAFLEEKFGGSQQLSVVIDTGRKDGLRDPQVLELVARLQDYLEGRPEVGSTASLADLVKETYFTLRGDDPAYYAIPSTPQAVAQVLLLYEMGGGEVLGRYVSRDYAVGQVTARVASVGMAGYTDLTRSVEAFLARELPPGASAYVTGTPTLYVQISHKLVQSQIVSLGTSLAVVGVIVAILMGSWVAGLCALIPLAVAIAADFGVMGYAGADLDMATVMIASLTVGIGVDYAVHFLVRYRRSRGQGRTHPQALAATYRTAGRGILFNALTLVFGFLVMLFSRFGAIATFGWLIALTMVASSVGAMFVLPAVLGWLRPRWLAPQVCLGRGGRFGLRLEWLPANPQQGKED
ncbi:MAG: efflux RND transporter permease subunit [Candidatus Bipolaricaulaceae bacterium]